MGILCLWGAPRAEAQVRGVYPTGMSAINSGGTPDPGYTYSNLFLFNSRDEMRGPDGQIVDTGQHAVMIDLNTLTWVSRNERLGGAKLSMAATLLVSSNSLQSDTAGAISSGGGFGKVMTPTGTEKWWTPCSLHPTMASVGAVTGWPWLDMPTR